MRSFFKPLRRLSEVAAFGAFAFLLASFPVVCGLAAHFIARHFGHASSDRLSLQIGLLSLLALPLGVAGNALHKSLEYARKKEKDPTDTASPARQINFPDISPFDAKDLVSTWQTSLEVQQHFNDLELQIRNFAVTLLVAVMGGTAFTLKEGYTFQLGDQIVPLALVVLLAGVLGWLAFYFMDKFWYHRLLIGSVIHTINSIEAPYGRFAPLGLSTRIGHESAIPIWRIEKPKGKRTHWMEIHSTERIDLFYSAGLFFFGLLIAGILLVPQSPVRPPSPPDPMAKQQVKCAPIPSKGNTKPTDESTNAK